MPFKRILYGLLILSVLTSEGSAFFNKVTAPLRGCFIDYYEAANLNLCLKSEQGRVENTQKNFNSLLSLEEILKNHSGDNSNSLYTFECSGYGSRSSYIYSMTGIPVNSGYKFEEAFPGTDISPPTVVISGIPL